MSDNNVITFRKESERILNKITNYPENIIIASIDSLFGIPNYRISEKILEIILNANDFATKKLHIITGLKDEYLFTEIKRGSLKMFYEFKVRFFYFL